MITGVDYTGVVVGFLCHDGQGNFLFHKRSKNNRDEHGKWDWGGGKLEFGETVKETLVRELKEEYGCDVISVDEALPVTIWRGITAGKKTHWVVLTHIVRVDRDEVKLNEPRTMDDIGWFKIDKLPKPLHRGVAEEVVRFKDIISKYIK